MNAIKFPLNSESQFVKYVQNPEYHLLLLDIPPDNRFTPESVPAILEALTYIQTERDPKPLITSSTTAKYFSNGLNFERALATPNFFDQFYYPLMRAFLEFPWPTIAWINGHAFAAGFMVAECHDYLVMNPKHGFLCLNELQFGAPLMGPLISIFRVRYGAQMAQEIALTAHRFTASEALKRGIITAVGGLPEAEKIAVQVAKLGESPTYGAIRKEIYKDVIRDLKSYNVDRETDKENLQFEKDFYDGIVRAYRARM